MPARLEHEQDQVTLHNQGLININQDPSAGFEKLEFLLQQEPQPQETFENLLLLYVKYDFLDTAADLLAENAHLTATLLSPHVYDFLDAVLLKYSALEEAYKKLSDLGDASIENLRKITKQIQDLRNAHFVDEPALKKSVNEYDQAVDRYY